MQVGSQPAGIAIIYCLNISFDGPSVTFAGDGSEHCQRYIADRFKMEIGPHFQGDGRGDPACGGRG